MENYRKTNETPLVLEEYIHYKDRDDFREETEGKDVNITLTEG
jgi:hypothetical protein